MVRQILVFALLVLISGLIHLAEAHQPQKRGARDKSQDRQADRTDDSAVGAVSAG
jgi:hypothetical protein